jgi:hypothetical protein
MRKFMPISSAVVALIITSVLSGCGGTSVEPVTGPTRAGAVQTSSADRTTDSAAAKTEAPAAVKAAVAKAAKAAEAAKVAKAKIAAAAKAAAADKAVSITKDNDPRASPTAPSPIPRSATLRETCSKVARAVSGLTGKNSPPTAPELDVALAQVKLLNRAGDTETRNALSALLVALPVFRDEDPAGVVNDGRVAYLDSLANLATRCEAVGSSALRWVG